MKEGISAGRRRKGRTKLGGAVGTPFACVPLWLVRSPDVTGIGLRLWVELWALCNWSTGELVQMPTKARLQELTGFGRTVLQRAVKELLVAGALSREVDEREAGRKHAGATYTLHFDRVAKRSLANRPGPKSGPPPGPKSGPGVSSAEGPESGPTSTSKSQNPALFDGDEKLDERLSEEIHTRASPPPNGGGSAGGAALQHRTGGRGELLQQVHGLWLRAWSDSGRRPYRFMPADHPALSRVLDLAEGDLSELESRARRLLNHQDHWMASNASPVLLCSRWNQLGVELAPRPRQLPASATSLQGLTSGSEETARVQAALQGLLEAKPKKALPQEGGGDP